jgi:hypothetical protein
MVIEYNLQLIIILRQLVRLPFVETVHTVLAEAGEVLVLIMGEWQDGFDNSFETHYEPQIIII